MSDSHEHFIVPTKYYIGTFIALLCLTVITVITAKIDLGAFNVPLALFLAFTKMMFVVLFFMGLRWDKPISSILFFSSFFCIGLFLYFTFADIALRGDVFIEEAGVHSINSPVNVVTPEELEAIKKFDH